MMLSPAFALAMSLTFIDAAAESPAAKPQADASKPAAAKPADVKAAFALYAVEREILHYTNWERTRRGLPALVMDESLVKSARTHASWMTRSRTLRHTNKAVAENIAMGQGSAREAVRDWMNSSGHRANILSRGHGRIGIAAYTTPGGTIYWCQQFSY